VVDEIQKAIAEKNAEPFRLAMCRKDLLSYARYVFEKEYETPLLEAWYHALLCKALEKVASGEVTRLIINIPPAYGKTEFAVRLFVSWFLGNAPKKRVIYTSYSDDLANKTPAEVKGIITSKSYQKIFPNMKLGRKTADKEWYLESNGGMFSTTVGGGITGFHGNVVIIDDPQKAIEKNSKAVRDMVKDFYRGSITSRLRKDDPNSAIIVIMQRLHEDDLVGYLLDTEADIWTHINLTGIDNHELFTQILFSQNTTARTLHKHRNPWVINHNGDDVIDKLIILPFPKPCPIHIVKFNLLFVLTNTHETYGTIISGLFNRLRRVDTDTLIILCKLP